MVGPLYTKITFLKVTHHSYGWAPVRARIGLQPIGAVLYVCLLYTLRRAEPAIVESWAHCHTRAGLIFIFYFYVQ